MLKGALPPPRMEARVFDPMRGTGDIPVPNPDPEHHDPKVLDQNNRPPPVVEAKMSGK